MVDSGSVSN